MCDVFYCPYPSSAVSSSGHIKREKASPTKVSPFLSHNNHGLPPWGRILAVTISMIRAFSILLKGISPSCLSDYEIFESLLQEALRHPGKCPACGCLHPCYKKISPYRREMITVCDGHRSRTALQIPRLRCSSCGVSHAVLPEVLIPFGSYTVRFILTVLHEYLHRSCRVTDLCDHWQISVSTLYAWIRLFTTHYSVFFGIMNRIHRLCDGALQRISSDPSFPERFYSVFRFSFLQLQSLASRSARPG